jgi:hypothetical protein
VGEAKAIDVITVAKHAIIVFMTNNLL